MVNNGLKVMVMLIKRPGQRRPKSWKIAVRTVQVLVAVKRHIEILKSYAVNEE